MEGLFIPNLKLPKPGYHRTVTAYADGRTVYQFGGAQLGFAVPMALEDDEGTSTEEG